MRRLLSHRRERRGRGQALVEFALVIPIFLLLLFGLIDMARIVYFNSTLSQAAREGARLAAVEAYWVGRTEAYCNTDGGPVCRADVTELRADVLQAANRMMTPFAAIADEDLHLSCDATTPPTGAWSSPTHNCDTPTDRQPQGLVSVRIAIEIEPITPMLGQIIGSLELSGAATMEIN
ncbi:MAG TPA: TadE family protein [candidate division Zixibacteria bacterium]|nr:TadE family protein [candidate division Zixibacteria bacterium]